MWLLLYRAERSLKTCTSRANSGEKDGTGDDPERRGKERNLTSAQPPMNGRADDWLT